APPILRNRRWLLLIFPVLSETNVHVRLGDYHSNQILQRLGSSSCSGLRRDIKGLSNLQDSPDKHLILVYLLPTSSLFHHDAFLTCHSPPSRPRGSHPLRFRSN
ncbi:hypothetical protein F5146DRAFT_1028566, partial [Armillaria mellea]